MYERFTDRARKVMQLANQEAQRFNHEYIGTEHILLGLAKEGTGVAANVLKNLNLDLRKIRLEVENLVQIGEMVPMGKLPLVPRAETVIELSRNASRNLNDNFVGTEHLLLGLMLEGENVAVQVVENLGVTPDSIIKDIHLLLGADDASEDVVDQPPKTATIYIVHVKDHVKHDEFHGVVELSDGVFFHVNSDNLVVFSQSDGTETFVNVNHMIGLSVTPDKAIDPNGE